MFKPEVALIIDTTLKPWVSPQSFVYYIMTENEVYGDMKTISLLDYVKLQQTIYRNTVDPRCKHSSRDLRLAVDQLMKLVDNPKHMDGVETMLMDLELPPENSHTISASRDVNDLYNLRQVYDYYVRNHNGKIMLKHKFKNRLMDRGYIQGSSDGRSRVNGHLTHWVYLPNINKGIL